MANNVNGKVRIPKEVAEAIEYFISPLEVSNDTLIKVIVEKNNYGPHSAALIEYAKDNFETLVKALYIGYEIEQPPKKITLELTLEELGYIICDMGVACTGEAEDDANERGINYNWRDCDSLHTRLINLYEEEARA